MIDRTTVQLLASLAALDRIQKHVASTIELVGDESRGVVLETCQAVVEVSGRVRERTFEDHA